MKVLVTGHHGYIGSVTTPVLEAAGHEVVGLDTFFYWGCDFGREGTLVPEMRVDVRDVDERHLEGFDAVVHLAALSNDPLGDLRSAWTYDINLEGTLSLARAAKAAGVGRFVFASSCSMYGASSTGELLDETAPLRPLTPYAESKVRAEEGLHGLADEDFSPVYMRNATAYGVSPRLRLDVVLNNLAAWAHTTGKVRLLSDGSSWRPLVHVEDIAGATALILMAPRQVVHDRAFNVGSDDQNVRIRDLAAGLEEDLGCDVQLSGDATADPRSYRVDFTRIATSLPEFGCRWNVRSGASQLVHAYSSVGLTYEDFVEMGRYTRLAQLKRLVAGGRLDEDLRWVDESAHLPVDASDPTGA
jgi:nucleoside-diphosphate-sugar epimerase